MKPHRRFTAVASDSHRRRFLGACILGLAIAGSHRAHADAPAPSTAAAHAPTEAVRQPLTEPRGESYALPLGLAYLLAPGLALAAGGGVFELTNSDGIALTAGAAMFSLPPLVHVYHGESERGLAGFGAMLGATFGGVLGGGLGGYLVGSGQCEESSESTCWGQFETTIIGAVTGGVVGYVGHAIYDVAANSSQPEKLDRASRASIPQLWLVPLAARGERDGARSTELHGVLLGVTSTL